MPIFALEKLEAIQESGVLSFYKVLVDGKCQFDEFCNKLLKSKTELKSLRKILASMNWLAENNQRLPITKFNSIKNKQKVFAHEFKEQSLRVYVLKIDPNVFVVLGGCKKNQERDVNELLDIVETKGLRKFINDFDFEQLKRL